MIVHYIPILYTYRYRPISHRFGRYMTLDDLSQEGLIIPDGTIADFTWHAQTCMPPRCITSRLLSHLPAAIAHSCDLQVALFPEACVVLCPSTLPPHLRQLPQLRSHQAPPTTFLSSTRSSILPHGARPGGDNGTDACTSMAISPQQHASRAVCWLGQA